VEGVQNQRNDSADAADGVLAPARRSVAERAVMVPIGTADSLVAIHGTPGTMAQGLRRMAKRADAQNNASDRLSRALSELSYFSVGPRPIPM
jgi:hypothetical protein